MENFSTSMLLVVLDFQKINENDNFKTFYEFLSHKTFLHLWKKFSNGCFQEYTEILLKHYRFNNAVPWRLEVGFL